MTPWFSRTSICPESHTGAAGTINVPINPLFDWLQSDIFTLLTRRLTWKQTTGLTQRPFESTSTVTRCPFNSTCQKSTTNTVYCFYSKPPSTNNITTSAHQSVLSSTKELAESVTSGRTQRPTSQERQRPVFTTGNPVPRQFTEFPNGHMPVAEETANSC